MDDQTRTKAIIGLCDPLRQKILDALAAHSTTQPEYFDPVTPNDVRNIRVPAWLHSQLKSVQNKEQPLLLGIPVFPHGDNATMVDMGIVLSTGHVIRTDLPVLTIFTKDEEHTSQQPIEDRCYGFGTALMKLRNGSMVSRRSWAEGTWIVYVASDQYSVRKELRYEAEFRPALQPFIGIKTSKGGFAPWAASSQDLLAEDWFTLL